MKDLIGFLKSIILKTALIDKKYKEAIPEIISQMKICVPDSENELKCTKRRAKKMKVGRNGLYHREECDVRKWWNSNKPELRDDEVTAKPEEIRYHISCLRTRETQLQMIVILEILALEKLVPAESLRDTQLPGTNFKTPPKPHKMDNATSKSKSKSKIELPVLLDLLADRLCIWNSTMLDEVRALAESQVKGGVAVNSQKSSSDTLKDFCVDIITPLYESFPQKILIPFTDP